MPTRCITNRAFSEKRKSCSLSRQRQNKVLTFIKIKIKSKNVCFGLVVNRKLNASNLPYCPYTERYLQSSMDQQEEAKKEVKRRRMAYILGIGFFATLFILTGFISTGTKLTRELQIDGRVFFTYEHKYDYLIVMNNDMISGVELADQLRKNFNTWDRLTKTSNSNIIKIYRNDSLVSELTIDFDKAEEAYRRKMEYLDKKRR